MFAKNIIKMQQLCFWKSRREDNAPRLFVSRRHHYDFSYLLLLPVLDAV